VFPNTKHNIDILVSTSYRDPDLERIGQDLEGGLTFTLNSGEAIDLPMNCIHKVWTLEGCFLANIDFATRDSVKAYPRIMSTGLDRMIDTPTQVELFNWLLESLGVALENGRADVVLRVWVELQVRMRDWAQDRAEWGKEAKSILMKCMLLPSNQQCPCGGMGPEEGFQMHFEKWHSLSEDPSVSKRPFSEDHSRSVRPKRRCQ